MNRFQQIVLLMSLAGALNAGVVLAQQKGPANTLIDNYVKALAGEDESKINEAWLALSVDPQALKTLKETNPRVFQSYEYWRIKREIQQLRNKKFFNSPVRGSKKQAASGTGRSVNRPNGETARGNPNQNKRSNRNSAMSFPNQDRRPNQDIVNSIPNQEQPSNQERIRNRLR